MGHGWSLFKQESGWQEERFEQTEFSNRRLELEFERDGDVVTLSLASTDGIHYAGDYRYREGSNSNGEARFQRYAGPEGSVLIGEWKESEKSRGGWLLHINHAPQ